MEVVRCPIAPSFSQSIAAIYVLVAPAIANGLGYCAGVSTGAGYRQLWLFQFRREEVFGGLGCRMPRTLFVFGNHWVGIVACVVFSVCNPRNNRLQLEEKL